MGKVKKRRKASRTPPKKQPRGFDYGCLPYAFAVGSPDFLNHLNAASIDVVAYGDTWSEEVHQTVPTISLVGRHGAELAEVFKTFNAWSNLTDPDSVEITFVFRKTGGYVLVISAEFSRLERRCLGFSRTHRPLVFTGKWFKPMDSTNPLLLRFREYCTAPVAPYLFSGMIYSGQRELVSASSLPGVQLIPGLEPLLKFDVTFLDEDEVTPNTTGWIALNMGRKPLPTSPKEPQRPAPEDVALQRVKTLGYHFPVTLERLRRTESVRLLTRQLEAEGIRAWQIEQALCNLILSDDLGLASHYAGLSARKVESYILGELQSRYEVASGVELRTHTAEEIRTQVLADGNALLRHLGEKTVDNLVTLHAALKSLSALEAPTAVEDPQSGP